jgi:PilZ domain
MPERDSVPKLSHYPVGALAHSLVVPEDAPDRRSEARYATQDPAEIEILSGPSEPIYGTVIDVSRSGLRVALSQRIDRGEHVKVTLHDSVIFGEIRYCRSIAGTFHVGIRIQDLVRPADRQNEHIADEPLSLYAIGKGLSVPEVLEVRRHLTRCATCRAHLAEKQALLNPTPRRRPLA